VFPALLELAGDLDVVARQLFEGLVFQLVRWYSGSRSQADADAIAVLDTLAEGAAHADGGPTRELCIRGVVEFLKFAVKQVCCALMLPLLTLIDELLV
jgi:DNA-dependent protein kinase catalytic subunit